ncbi:heat shock protein DnaJ domain protein [Rippkaea orientalis PCC 8801]|uniref:Heat shock protein DnaJ domain protein n=1 Tax=Rippkaea orientalis (strain PCC 8801 / RF-1) TaxID=41431 RepID=B7JYC1_RIPO1|nr:IMS domain-containing protein [Rippkaea orientalis]ACK67223.1 heat shock protein DnaJ domain protein [Rippkaea orientalis PCC 8801]
MRIPLDYYKILGIFPQVTDEQLEHAYRDRSLQLPRREYSEAAIAARKQLLTQAHDVLSNSAKRTAYEALFLEDILPKDSNLAPESSSETTDRPQEDFPHPGTSTLDIAPEQLVGALMILQELGEYELVIKLGEPHLLSFPSLTLFNSPEDQLSSTRADIILTLALAKLELSREQWQLEEYEQAATLGSQALELLQKNSLFPGLQTEICHELNKLRPYRILQLLAQPENNKSDRQRGQHLLQEMLQERQGIDGLGNDHSGLDIDDFLRFIQQLRHYLTAEEQQELFLAEAHRPSAVAAYLAVYALIAQGFAQKQPALLLEAQTMLSGLAKRQDVSLEQGICALLLGQTQAASQILESCQDTEALALIREHSQGSPDLLPGLCWYGEYWLKIEVLAHFRDLRQYSVSLADYFAEEEVQTYLEQLSGEPQEILLEEQQQRGVTMTRSVSRRNHSLQEQGTVHRRRVPLARSHQVEPQLLASGGGGVAAIATSVPTPVAPHRRRFRDQSTRPSRTNRDRRLNNTRTYPNPQEKPPIPVGSPAPSEGVQLEPVPSGLSKRKKQQRPTTFKPRPWFVWIAVFAALGMVGLSVKWIQYSMSPLAALEEEQLVLNLAQPPIQIPSEQSPLTTKEGLLSPQGAKQVIQLWLSSKSQAFGSNHEIESLNQILGTSLLALWKDRAQKLKENRNYWQYTHDFKIESLKTTKNSPKTAIVKAKVTERAKFYEKGQLNSGRSYDDQLRVEYQLTHQGDSWLIESIRVIN